MFKFYYTVNKEEEDNKMSSKSQWSDKRMQRSIFFISTQIDVLKRRKRIIVMILQVLKF